MGGGEGGVGQAHPSRGAQEPHSFAAHTRISRNTHAHARPCRLATLEDSVKATVRKLTEQEKDNSRRIQELESKLGEKMQRQIEGALDNTVSSRLNSITETVKENLNTQVQKVQELSESVAKGGRSWVFPFTILAVVVLALGGWSWMFSSATKRRLDKPHLG